MIPIRVIGRIDRAEQIHSALLAAGADARLVTSAASAAVAETGRDGTAVDVLANGLDVCAAIKRKLSGRPVVVVTFDEQGSDFAKLASFAAKGSRGPDAHLSWPASGLDLMAACEQATAAARTPRPRRLLRELLGYAALCGMVGVVCWALFDEIQAMRSGLRHSSSPWLRFLMALFTAFIFFEWAVWSRRQARTSSSPRWHRAVAVGGFILAAFEVMRAILVLVT